MEARLDLTQERCREQQAFLQKWAKGCDTTTMSFLAADCSVRSYYRINQGGKGSVILLDAPAEEVMLERFANRASLLKDLGLRVPEIYAMDLNHGLMLLEDLGDDTYGRLLRNGADPAFLLKGAVDILIVLQRRFKFHQGTGLTQLTTQTLFKHVQWFLRWYLPLYRVQLTSEQEQAYYEIWWRILHHWDCSCLSLVLYDYHVDNLIRCPGEGIQACGLLDFQDSVLSSPIYDLVALLEDARWDVPLTLEEDLKSYYYSKQVSIADRVSFDIQYAILAAQKAVRNLGLFARLAVRDGKSHMLCHIPRLWRYLRRGLEHPLMGELKTWIQEVVHT